MTTQAAEAATWTADDWAALWAFCGVAVTAIAAFLALVQLRAYTRESLDRARPFVIVDFVFVGERLQFQISNTSPSAALRVRVKSDKPIRSSQSSGFANAGLDELLGGRVIPLLAPGRMIAWTFDAGHHAFAPDVMDTYRVTVSYDDPRLRRRREPLKLWTAREPVRYSEDYDLSIEHYTEASVPLDGPDRIVDALGKIRGALKS